MGEPLSNILFKYIYNQFKETERNKRKNQVRKRKREIKSKPKIPSQSSEGISGKY